MTLHPKLLSHSVLPVVGIILMLSLCTGCKVKARHDLSGSEGTTEIIWPEVAALGNDSLRISGVLLTDSTELVVPKCYSFEDGGDSEPESKIEAPKYSWKRCPKIIIDSLVNGYSVSITVLVDSCGESKGAAKYHFSSTSGTFDIITAFDWPVWYNEVGYQHKYENPHNKTYHIQGMENIVQRDSSEIVPAVFCFKDADFDGVKEICFRTQGYNREYYLVYKISNRRPCLLTSAPFNNIVYSKYGYGSTEFDYERKQITVNEQFGAATHWTDTYYADENSSDLCSPMKHLKGIHRYATGSREIEQILEKGSILKESYSYSVNTPYDYVNVLYRTRDGRCFDVDTIILEAKQHDSYLERVIFPLSDGD